MMPAYRSWLTVAGATGSGLLAGLFFAYSAFTLQGLRRLPPVVGLQAMQSVNRSANASPAVALALLGTGAVCAVLAITALADLGQAPSRLQLAGAVLYLVGGLGLTIGYHVPRNNALGEVDPASAGAVAAWERYAAAWASWNHARTITSLAATLCLVLALRAE
jgi:uncharacterized membrane protein